MIILHALIVIFSPISHVGHESAAGVVDVPIEPWHLHTLHLSVHICRLMVYIIVPVCVAIG